MPVEVLHGHALVAGEGTGVGGEEEADAIVVGWTSGSLGVGGEAVGAIGVGGEAVGADLRGQVVGASLGGLRCGGVVADGAIPECAAVESPVLDSSSVA